MIGIFEIAAGIVIGGVALAILPYVLFVLVFLLSGVLMGIDRVINR